MWKSGVQKLQGVMNEHLQRFAHANGGATKVWESTS